MIISHVGHGAVWNLTTGEAEYAEDLEPEPVYEVKVDGPDILLKRKA